MIILHPPTRYSLLELGHPPEMIQNRLERCFNTTGGLFSKKYMGFSSSSLDLLLSGDEDN